ncbi:MAG: hypothetical protein Q9216_001882 [Gyalolechia sp. 2 TL-2023]
MASGIKVFFRLSFTDEYYYTCVELHTRWQFFRKTSHRSVEDASVTQCAIQLIFQRVAFGRPRPSGDRLKAAEPYKEFSSSRGVYRGFCSSCGTAFSWRSEEAADEIELLIGTIDEKWLIGDRTEQVSSQSLTDKETFEKVLSEDDGVLGREICTPEAGQMYVRNAIKGVTDMRLVGKRFVEVTQAKMEIAD